MTAPTSLPEADELGDDECSAPEKQQACQECTGEGCEACDWTGAAGILRCQFCAGAGCAVCNGDGSVDLVSHYHAEEQAHALTADHDPWCDCPLCQKLGRHL